MKMETYQEWCQIGATYPSPGGQRIVYSGLALSNEAGEVAGHVKKMLRDDKGHITGDRRDKMVEELGDVFWYFANMCTDLGVTMEEVAQANIEKLVRRHGRKRPGTDEMEYLG